MTDQTQHNSGADPTVPDHTPASQLDRAELLRRVAGRVYALWQAEVRSAQERRR